MRKVLLVFCLVLAMAFPAFAIDSTQLFNENVLGTKIEQASTGGVPVGTVIAWPVSSNPDDAENWLECNGQAISPTVYPELFAVVGGNVPDLRGLFLRGNGGNAAALGVPQGDAIRNIYGEFDPGLCQVYSSGVFTSYYTGGTESSYNNMGSRYVFDASRVVPTANENRPVNKAVRYLIRAMP